jgi:hypothetical protein
VYKEIKSAIARIVAQIPAQAVEPDRQQAYRDLVVERASDLVEMAAGMSRSAVKPN